MNKFVFIKQKTWPLPNCYAFIVMKNNSTGTLKTGEAGKPPTQIKENSQRSTAQTTILLLCKYTLKLKDSN